MVNWHTSIFEPRGHAQHLQLCKKYPVEQSVHLFIFPESYLLHPLENELTRVMIKSINHIFLNYIFEQLTLNILKLSNNIILITIKMFYKGLNRMKLCLTFQKQDIIKVPFEIFYSTVKQTQLYHQFIPWCSHSQIVQTISERQNYTRLAIRFNQFKEINYLSHVRVQQDKDKAIITSICKENPLRHLQSRWIIQRCNDQGCSVDYFLDFQFQSILYQLTSSMFMNIMGVSMWNIFVQRAKILYQNDKARIQSSKINAQNNIKGIQNAQKYNLQQYLSQNGTVKEIYMQSKQIRQRIDRIYERIKGTNNIKIKLQFQIKNLLIHYDIFV